MRIRWDNYRTGAVDNTEVPDSSLQITFEELQNENGDTIANYNFRKDIWIRHSDNTEWTDIAIGA